MIDWLIWLIFLIYIFTGAGVAIGVAGLSEMDLNKKGVGLFSAIMWPFIFGVMIGRYVRNTNLDEG